MKTLLILLVLMIIALIGLYKIFERQGIPGWKAFVPVVNALEWLKLIGKPRWWVIMLFIPLVNLFYLASMLTGMANAHRNYSFGHHFAAIAGFFAYLPYLGFSKNEKYVSPNGLREGENMPKKGFVREWADALIFAIFAAHLIRVFFIEAYKIPTSSMEPTLQVGDFMFVSKAHYGSRVPNTPLGLPFMHHTIPGTKSRAYSELIKWDYKRLPGLQKIKRNDIAVFNIPFEHDMQDGWSKVYYSGIEYDSRPVDKREHYIKRVIGVPGDSIEVRDRQVYVNGKIGENPELLQFKYQYKASTPSGRLSMNALSKTGVRTYINYRMGGGNPQIYSNGQVSTDIDATPAAAAELSKNPLVTSVDMQPSNTPAGFPSSARELGWTGDNYGPIWIPKKGSTVQLTKKNFDIYRTAIEVYEGNEVSFKDNKILLNGEEVSSYTFKMDYFWMMGDNRHSSLDSRAWGFVPEDHIVGKPLFVFFSSEFGKNNPGIKWNRVLKKAQDMN